MTYNILIIIAILFAILALKQNRNALNVTIVSILIASLIPGIFEFQQKFITIGFYLYGFSLLLSIVYPFIIEEINNSKKIAVLGFTIPLFLTFIFELFNYAGYGLVKMTLLIPIGIFLYALINRVQYKSELCFMILFFVIASFKVYRWF